MIEAKRQNFILRGKVDFMVASGKYEPETPFFCFHEYKKEKGKDSDPIGQMLAEMIAAQALNNNKLPIYGAILKGENLFRSKLTEKGLIIIGNEGKGIRPEIQEQITHPIAIPPYADRGTESLNAAMATGIICATFRNAHSFD